ncbi:HPt (histidine-containing phosphotransfer) domain-containing protein [Roseivivax lentus]|uniref:HPt (Histidine-containing phosphotransfer) domain-containing protein n=1 Tax=Roseivivax lentus TaxID=633194 RepID=A0A1N7NXK0_9RHOB|nr:Hpt domain-containing protein [Roseivivax lentus]SIT03050.1 HPt (histidine-containing phosphotransfer) domain-containing protein [Roseivivax lentus]
MRLGFLKKLSDRDRPAATPAAEAAPAPDAPDAIAVIDDADALVVIDLSRLGELMQVLSTDAVRQLILIFLSETEAELPAAPVAPEETAATARRVHKLAGTAAVLGAQRFHAALGTAETALKSGECGPIEAAIADVHRVWAATKARLEMLDLDTGVVT